MSLLGEFMSKLRPLGLILLCILCITAVYYPAQAQSSGQTHTVQPGETLFRIALTYNVTAEQLISVNHLTDPSHILVGQVLIIPSTAAPLPAVANAAPVYYVVQGGDTLNRIAQTYGVALSALMAANGISDMNHIEVGQTLTIPGVSAPGSGATIPNQPAPPIEPTIAAPTALPPTPIPPTAVPPTPIPPTAIIPTTAPATVAAPPVDTSKLRTHTVLAGEELSQIAQQYGVTWPQLAALNNITDPNSIYAGTVLKIPDSSVNPPTTMENSTGVPPGPMVGANVTNKSITVVLHDQRVYAYENGVLVRNVLVSTGLPGTPTVLGTYHIYVKYNAQLMTGPGYYLPGVPWVMYFYEGYSFHGTYWHHNWGHPMSHGCVNMPTDEALWLYQWAPVGTTITVVA